tara:strand:+ start:5218 stop:5388 length:171 start_codon:yes stop_codon:yes gene_type:complete
MEDLIEEIYNQVDDKITNLSRQLTELEYHQLRFEVASLLKQSAESFLFELERKEKK